MIAINNWGYSFQSLIGVHRPHFVVVALPAHESLLGLVQFLQQLLVEALVAQLAVVAFKLAYRVACQRH
jgi:hypothetical protein